ncbi:MAG TPA: S8 family serine peptidase, partial [Puia sp.]
MYRVLTAFLLIMIFTSESYSQRIQPLPVLKNGQLGNETSLMHHKISHASWQACRFGDQYFFVLQLNQIAGTEQKVALARRGIVLEHYISGNNYLATCSKGPDLGNPELAGIDNIFALPPKLKIDARLRDTPDFPKGPLDYVVVTCFPGDKNQITRSLQTAGAEIIETKIKPANSWFIRASPAIVKKIADLAIVFSLSPIHLQDIPLNYNNHGLLSVQSLTAALGRNLTGKNLTVGIGDNADPSTHIDLSGKLIMRTDEPVTNHGTHTAGTLAGGGILNPLYTGMAPRAHLVVNDFSNILVNSPTYVTDYNIPLTSNSYFNGALNCPGDGDYNILSNYVDSQMLGYPKLLHVFAAGNDGGLTCGTFPASFATIKSGFQTAKNVLTV